jgi:hypothetical protein
MRPSRFEAAYRENEHPVWLGFIVLSTLLSALGIIAVNGAASSRF